MGFWNKKETKAQEPTGAVEGDSIVILGGGCNKCNELETATHNAIAQLGWDVPISHESDFLKIAAYGVMTTPALVFNNKVLSEGNVLSEKEVIALLQKAK